MPRQLEAGEGDNRLTATVRRAKPSGELQRIQMFGEADSLYPGNYPKLGWYWIYTNILCATPAAVVIVDGKESEWPMSFEDFLEVDQDLIDIWVEAVWEFNPTWKLSIQGDETPEQEKKDLTPQQSEP
jgi:hypothetical protein